MPKVWRWLQNWGWNKGFLVLIPLGLSLVAIWAWPGIDASPVTQISSDPRSLYLFSTTAQSLAAVLALVFAISLVVAQLSSRYSHKILARLFDIPTTLYILLFISAISLPVWSLASPKPWPKELSLTTAVQFSLSLGAASLLFLIPYFLSFKNKLDPEMVLRDLKRVAIKQLDSLPKRSSDHLLFAARVPLGEEPREVNSIDDFILSAFSLKDYTTSILALFESGYAASRTFPTSATL